MFAQSRGHATQTSTNSFQAVGLIITGALAKTDIQALFRI
jgi:hypothetical protein